MNTGRVVKEPTTGDRERYSRQAIFPGIGWEGQKRLGAGFAVVVGCGALGGTISAALVRAGVGRVRIVDRDYVEIHNLHRQGLYTEQDVAHRLPKAEAAARHLHEANDRVQTEAVVAEFNIHNARALVESADVIVDGLDNLEARLLLNDVALELGIPWVYGGAVASTGMTAVFLPGGRPCFRCLVRSAPIDRALTADTTGVVNAAPWIAGSLEAAEALKVILADPEKAPVSRELVVFDLWQRSFECLPLESFTDPECPVCGKERSKAVRGAMRAE